MTEHANPPQPGKKQTAIALMVLTVVILTTFRPCLNNGFTNWDDDKYVTENPLIKNISRANVKAIFSTLFVGAYTPLPVLSFMVEYRLAGPAPGLYHAVNLLFHWAACILVFFLTLHLGGSVIAALAIALLFGVHPLKVESVAWVTERKDVMSAFFYFAAVLLYTAYSRRRNFLRYGLVVLAFVFALGSKPAAMTLPFALMIYDHWRQRPVPLRSWLDKVPMLAIAAVFGIIATAGQQAFSRTRVLNAQSLMELPGIVARELIFYLGKTFVPVRLSCLYPVVPAYKAVLPNILALLGIAALVVMVIVLYRRYRLIGGGLIFFLVTLLPALNVVRSGLPVADRFMYVPVLGLILALAAAGRELSAGIATKDLIQKTALILSVIVVILFGVMTNARCRVWRDSLTLWNDAIAKYPDLSVAYTNRGKYFLDTRRFSEALNDLDRAIILERTNALAFYNRGHAYFNLGDNDKAISDFSAAVALDSNYARAYDGRGMVYSVAGDHDRALADFNRAVAIFPRFAGAYNNRGLLYYDRRAYDLALADFDRSIALNPDYPAVYNNRGMLYFEMGRYDLSIGDFTSALKLEPEFAEAFYNRGLVHQKRGDLATALADLSRAIFHDAEYGEAYRLRAYVYYQAGDLASAWRDVEAMRRIGFAVDPRFIDMLNRGNPINP